MKTLFEKDSFDMVTLWDLGSRYLNKGPEQIKVIGFQRNAVWKEEKVEALWDSFLSGFPVGSILLARQKDFWDLGTKDPQFTRANPSEDTLIDEKGGGFVVVDGQQRLNGIAQGFMNFDPGVSRSRLWIDLARPANPDQRQFEFYLCTSDNPFGVNGPNALTRDEIRIALASIEQENADDSVLNLMDTYPYRSKLPVPFYEFCQFIEVQLAGTNSFNDFATLFPTIDWHLPSRVLKLISEEFKKIKIRDIDNELIEPLKRTVLNGNDVDNYQIPVILVPKIDSKRLGKLFERVNISGEVPPQAELFFSALKLRYPPINNYVADVYNDNKLSGLLSPTEIVLIAIRLIDPSITSLELNRFDKLVKQYGNRLIRLMKSKNGQPSQFMQCLLFIYNAIQYDEDTNVNGLPRQLIQSLRPRVWQTIAIWVNVNFEKIKENGIQPKDRLNLIRFALLDSLNYFIKWERGLSTYIKSPAFITLPVEADLTRSYFPSLGIFKRVKNKVDQDGYSLRFSKPLSYNAWLNKDSTPTYPNDNQLSNEDAILMYAQRHYLNQWEKFHTDVDHIVPSQWMVFRAGPLPESVFWKVRGVPSYLRFDVLHQTGNFRYWPDSLNRSYQDRPPNEKFIYRQIDEETDPEHKYYGLLTVKDVLAASFIDSDDAKQWEDLCVEKPKNWNGKRFASFKDLVTKRRYRMYKEMFEALLWEEWIEKINGN
jgi:hypothetical protein